jgi:hypothetical protein
VTAERAFTITFVPRGGVDGVKAVRRLLKYAGRYLGLRATTIQEHRLLRRAAEPITRADRRANHD